MAAVDRRSTRPPARSTPRHAPSGPARDRMLLATLRVIAKEGLESVTHRRVAELAGVALGSTTHHFTSREDLLREAFRAYLAAATGVIAALVGEARRTRRGARAQIQEFASALIARELQEPSLMRAEYELLLFAARDEPLAADFRAWEGQLVASLAELFESGGTARPVDAARTLVNLVRGFELERLIDHGLDASALRRRLAPVLDGLLASGASGDGAARRLLINRLQSGAPPPPHRRRTSGPAPAPARRR